MIGDHTRIEGGIHFYVPPRATPLQRPPRAKHFTGRERELAQLLDDLQPGRVVTLCGPGGIGKTARPQPIAQTQGHIVTLRNIQQPIKVFIQGVLPPMVNHPRGKKRAPPAHNVRYPLEVYRFFKQTGAKYVSFLPMVEPLSDAQSGVSDITVPAETWGDFLCTIFDEWISKDIGKIKVQIFEEAARTAFDQEHSLCIFRPECGDIPVVEHNGDFYSCDHFVDKQHHLGNIIETPLAQLLESPAQRAFGKYKSDSLPRYCRECEVKTMCHGECPKNRFVRTPDGEKGLNYLCPGYKRFFAHCKPFVEEVAEEWQRKTESE